MPDPDREERRLEDAARGSDDSDTDGAEDASSPFDHPAFLPVLLWGLAVWFGFDGWFNPKIEAVMFNRWGFAVLVVLALYYTIQSVREVRAREERE
jgi:hypothetical protein